MAAVIQFKRRQSQVDLMQQAVSSQRTRLQECEPSAARTELLGGVTQRGHLWLRLKENEGAIKMVEKELEHAIEAPLRDVEEYEEDSETEVTTHSSGIAKLPSAGILVCHRS